MFNKKIDKPNYNTISIIKISIISMKLKHVLKSKV